MSSVAVDRINELQKMIQAGKEPSTEEIAAAIQALRIERGFAGETKSAKVTSAKEIASIDIAALFAPKTEDTP